MHRVHHECRGRLAADRPSVRHPPYPGRSAGATARRRATAPPRRRTRRPLGPRRATPPSSPAPRPPGRPGDAGERPPRARARAVRASSRRPSAAPSAAETGGSKLRGILAVVGSLPVTLAAAAVESFVGIGLGTVTLVALVALDGAGHPAGAPPRPLLGHGRRPPLVFVAVAVADIALAPSAHFSLATLATLLIRGFPAMAIATVVALVIGLDPAGRRR